MAELVAVKNTVETYSNFIKSCPVPPGGGSPGMVTVNPVVCNGRDIMSRACNKCIAKVTIKI